jgi:DNA-binding winged helix-turn-helix (wHTH) protein/TolB-like protein/predicted negative regulator of RcsB-dependent stress response
MVKNDVQIEILEFAGFQLIPEKRLFLRDGEVIPLTPKVFDTLVVLVTNAGRIVGKDELMSAVWKDTIVEENNLNKNISTLRQILGENPGENRFIATIPGTGYKFVAAVNRVNDHDISEPGSNYEASRDGSGNNIDSIPSRLKDPRTVAVTGVIGVIVLGLVYLWIATPVKDFRTPTKKIAVLPFKPLVPENRDEAFEMGMADTLIARLSTNRELVVRPMGSVRRYVGLDDDPRAAGRALGVESVLDGSIQRWGDTIRVNVRLIRVEDGTSLWSGSFDERYTDIFTVQDAIAHKVAEALRVSLAGAGSIRQSTTNVEAYRLYLQGRFFALKATPPDIVKGIGFYQQAIEADPLYALAYAGLADAYRMQPITSDVVPADAFPKAKIAALRALEIESGLAEAFVALGWVASWYEWDDQAAETNLQRAIQIAPNNAEARRAYSVHLTKVGRHEEAVAEMRTARELDPLSTLTSTLEGQALFFAGRYDEAILRLEKTFEIDEKFWIARLQLGRVYIEQKRYDEAIRELEIARDISRGNTETISLIGYAYAKLGRETQARKEIETLNTKETLTPYYNLAMVYNGLGESRMALDLLEKALEQRDVRMILLKVDPKWNDLRSDPVFVGLLQQMNLS